MRWTTDELYPCSSNPRAVRRGEKVPATIGTVSDSFGLLNLGSLRRECAGVWFGGAEPATVRAGLLVRQALGLLFQEQLERSLGQPLCGNGGDLLHRSEVDIQTRPGIAEGSLGNDFAPLGRQRPESVKFLRRKTRSRHG